MTVFFSGWIGARDKQIAWNAKRFFGDLIVPRSDSLPMNLEKRHLFLILTMLPSKKFSKIPRGTLYIQNSHSKGHLTSFNFLIPAHVVYQTAELLVNSGYRELNWNFFSMVQRRKYDTILNITQCFSIYASECLKSRNQWSLSIVAFANRHFLQWCCEGWTFDLNSCSLI